MKDATVPEILAIFGLVWGVPLAIAAFFGLITQRAIRKDRQWVERNVHAGQ